MAQQHHPEGNQDAATGGRRTLRLIEKGWTVYDALEHPIGTVTDVDTDRGVLMIDGRPVGLDTYEVATDLVRRAGDNEVHLTTVIETESLEEGAAPRLVDAPADTGTRARTRSRVDVPPETAVTASPSRGARANVPNPAEEGVNPEAASVGGVSHFSPPYAAPSPQMQGGRETPSWGDDDGSGGWSMKKMGLGALAVGGLAAAGYAMRRRMRRRTPYERFMDSASDYLDFASDLASDFASELGQRRGTAWWAALAASALPIAYYAWPSSKPTYQEVAESRVDGFSGALGAYWQALMGSTPSMTDRARSLPGQVGQWMPSTDSLTLPSFWGNDSDSWMAGDWFMKPGVTVPAGLAVAALAVYLARRSMAKPEMSARIRDVMTRQPRVIQPDATVADAAAMMRQLNVGALPVCDGSRLIGMLTDRDITVRSTADGRDPHLTAVRDVMSPGVAWATEDDPVEEAARIMREHQIRRLPIVDDRHSLVGVISLGDLATNVDADAETGDTLERISEPGA